MSSNEEYLDSLLKAVTSEGQTDSLSDISDMSKEAESENMEQIWEGTSQNDLEQMLANIENTDIQETNLEKEMPDVYVGDDEEEEKAFRDPGDLFFGGEEEYPEDEIIGETGKSGSKEGKSRSDESEFDEFGSIFFENEDEDETEAGSASLIYEEAESKEESDIDEVNADTGETQKETINTQEAIEETETADEEAVSTDIAGEEDFIAAADGTGEEDLIAAADGTGEEDLIAAADGTGEEDLIAAADGIEEEDLIAAADGIGEEDLIAAADGIEEEDLIAAADGIEEEDLIAAADGIEEEDLIAAADSTEEEDLIAAADSTEEMPQTEETFDEEGFKEINDLLASSSGDDDEMFAMLESVEDTEEEGSDIGFPDEESGEEAESDEDAELEQIKEKPKKEKRKKEKKNKKKTDADSETENSGEEEADLEEGEKSGKKPGIFARFMNFLLEEDEEESKEKTSEPDSDEDELILGEASDENTTILEELDKEDAEKKPDKKEKKKKKKGKKGKGAEEASEDGEEGDGEEASEKGKKKKKEKKKKEKPEEIPAVPTKKLSARKIEVTAVLCLSILAAILLTIHLVPAEMDKERARDAYYEKDYEQVIEGFYGEELSDSDTLMYERAYTVLRMQRKIDGYNNFMRMGKETEAVNQLIEGVVRYREIYEDAAAYNVTEEIDEIYQTITDALYNKYGITPEKAEELYEMEDNFAYTLKLESIIDGVEYTLPSDEGENADTEEGNEQSTQENEVPEE